jgi:hypothetical protein
MNTSQKAGRKLKYGEPTTLMRVPNSMIPKIEEMLSNREILETQWQSSQIPPNAQRLLELMTERMLFPQMALIGTFRSVGGKEMNLAADELEKEINRDRVKYLSSNTTALLEVLASTDDNQDQVEQIGLSKITSVRQIEKDGVVYEETTYY